MSKYFLIIFSTLVACDTYVEDQRTADFEPIYFQQPEQVAEEPDFGSIYQRQRSLFAMEARAHRVGDILTVSFTESFQATKSQNAATLDHRKQINFTDSDAKLPVIGNRIPDAAELASSGERRFLI